MLSQALQVRNLRRVTYVANREMPPIYRTTSGMLIRGIR